MIKQRGFGFLHIFGIFILIVLAAVGYQQYRKKVEAEAIAEAKRIEVAEKKANAKKIEAQVNAMLEIDKEFDGAADLAGATARIALAPQVRSIQEIQARIEKLPADGCAIEVKAALERQVDASVRGFIAFMRKEEYESRLKQMESLKEKFVFLKEAVACKEQLDPDLN